MLVHTIFDLLAWAVAALIGRFVSARGWLAVLSRRNAFTEPYYFIALAIGALAGAILFGSLNLGLAGLLAPGHSIAGALAGGIVAVEAYKWRTGLRASTGGGFVAPLAAGIAIGRVGCFLAGLPDFTYGTATALPWGVDFGDGIRRHPVQLYESAAMLLFLVLYLRGIARRSPMWQRDGFYLFIAWYGVQRFAWEFLKPYPKLLGPLNLFHLLCLTLVAYGLVMLRQNRELYSAR